ncbi:MAG: tetratricopeptide repeat protein [Anaerolineae bacterium]|nr:tetratricopeptide repeat protein [Anaerolineae bacterium]
MDAEGSFGKWLRQRRRALDLTQADLANQVGCSTMTIRKIEADERRPSKQIAAHMADVLAIDADHRAAFMTFARQPPHPVPALPVQQRDVPRFHNLPLYPSLFVGREDYLAEIAARLADPDCRLLSLVGLGGIGKTRLAVQAVSENLQAFSDGVCFVPLGSVGSPDLIASSIASALQITLSGTDDAHRQIIHYLSNKHMLLVMDNFEHLQAGVGLLTDALASAPHLKFLVTSRERLNVQIEWVLPLQGLPFPDSASEQYSETYSAVQLFAQIARRIQPTFSLTHNLESVITICRMVEGMPLGLELAAGWLRLMSCQQIATQFQRHLDSGAVVLRDVPQRHRSLRIVFEHSWSLLSPDEQAVLAKLSVFRGGFTLEPAEQVAQASLVLLTGLIDKSLVRLSASGRYDMHELLRQYAAQKLAELDEAEVTAERHLAFFLELAQRAEPMLYGGEQVVWLDRLDTEHDNCRAALTWALNGGDIATGLRLGGFLGWFWYMRCYWNEGQHWLARLLAHGETAPESARAMATYRIAWLTYLQENHAGAITYLEQAWDLSAAIHDTYGMAFSRLSLGHILIADEDYERADQLLLEGQRYFEEAGSYVFVTAGLHSRGLLAAMRGDPDSAVQLYTEALIRSRAIDNWDTIAWCLFMLGNLALATGHPARARAWLTESLPFAQKVRNRWLVAEILHARARCALYVGDCLSARTLVKQSRMMYRELGFKVQTKKFWQVYR